MDRDDQIEINISSIMNKLSALNLNKVLLFGSYATEKVQEDSDIDLLVVLDDDTDPKSYDEWLEIKMIVRRALREINDYIPIDLLVYTVPQYEKLKKDMNSFQKEIHENGRILYEKAS